jgi:hypothetical protein
MAQHTLGQQSTRPAAAQAQQQQGALGDAAALVDGRRFVERIGDETGDAGDAVERRQPEPGQRRSQVLIQRLTQK